MIKDNLVPKKRFKEFINDGDWEQRKLGDVAEIVGGGTPSTSNPKYWDGDIDWYSPTEIGDHVYANESVKTITQLGLEKSSAKILPPDKTVLFTSRAGIGDMAILRHPGATNQGFQSLVLKEGIDTYFIYSMGHLIKKYAEKNASGSTFLEISGKTLGNMPILLPLTNEQTQIGTFFKTLDDLITLHQRKLEKLQQSKAAYLSEMFPKEGEVYPERRFEGFTAPWKQHKLGEMAEIIGGGTPSTNIPEYWDGDIDWYAPAELNGQIYADRSERKITKLGLEKSSAKILPANKTILFTSRAGIGKTAILKQPAATNQGFQSIIVNDDIDPYFVYSMSDKIKEKAEKVASGSTFAEISGKMLGNLEFMFPTKEEQHKIGVYFSNLDNLITLHQRKLEKLESIKKAYLNEMFV